MTDPEIIATAAERTADYLDGCMDGDVVRGRVVLRSDYQSIAHTASAMRIFAQEVRELTRARDPR
jgi:hypothetical protein